MTEKTIAGETAQSSALDVELAQVLEACLAELEAGNLPDRQALIAQHPAIAERLEACLNNLRFIEHVSMEESSNAPARTLIDSSGHLGDFRILCEIGRGGMGVVYEAEQISLRRRVALKVLPFAAVLDGRQLQRFKNEAQAAAVLKHPNIVGVHCVGCERGVHFYAMELVEGHSLAEVIQQLRDGISGESRVESRESRA